MEESLYERLGGAEHIRDIVSDAIDLHLKNPVIAPRFQNSDVNRLKQVAHEFFCAGAGGSECYSGREMREAHRGMNINEQEYLATMDDLVQAMEKHGVAPREKNEVIAILYSLKDDILHV
ncbi:MAG: group 1 truncated hemoglobin [Armatimonadetes bacterium]|nr:group 1 truncated hemoglobin [Armatimonadota bacterium]